MPPLRPTPGACRDALVVSPAWTALKGVSSREGLVVLAYERPYGPHTRLVQVQGSRRAACLPVPPPYTCPAAAPACRPPQLHPSLVNLNLPPP